MIDYGKHNILGINVHAVDYEAAVEKIIQAAHNNEPLSTSALAVHGVMTGVADEAHRYRLNHLDLIVPDGQPVRWAMKILYGTELPDRVYGPNLTLKVCQCAAEERLPLYLYGSKESVLVKFAENLKLQFEGLEIVGMQPSLFRQTTPEEKEKITQKIRNSGARIVLVGLGCPRQETWAFEYRDALQMPILAVGAAFDFHAGTLPQAPKWMQDRGLEWFFRLYQEPKRLWKRYLMLNPAYLTLLALQLTKLRHFDPADVAMPRVEMRYG